jgi:amino acid permease
MAKWSLRTASIYCLAVWLAIWFLFLVIRLSSFDIRVIPGIGPVMLLALVVALVAPIVAMGVAGAALLRQPRVPLNWLIFGCAIAAFVGQGVLFTITKWL